MKATSGWFLFGLAWLFSLDGCGLAEEAFISGATYDPCESIFYVCSNRAAASCVMGEAKYTDGVFPGHRSVVVTTVADTTIVVNLFFKDAVHPGEDMEIRWYETGCADVYEYTKRLSEDVFEMAGGNRVFVQEHKVRRAGDHLIEIYSDATATYLLRVGLITPVN